MAIHLGPASPRTSGSQPGPAGGEAAPGAKGPARSLFGLAPGGACHAGPVARTAVGSYPTVSPLPRWPGAVSSLWRYPSACAGRALPGAAAPWSPDFPRCAAPRPSSHPHNARLGVERRRRNPACAGPLCGAWVGGARAAQRPCAGGPGAATGAKAWPPRPGASPANASIARTSPGPKAPDTPGRNRARKAAKTAAPSPR